MEILRVTHNIDIVENTDTDNIYQVKFIPTLLGKLFKFDSVSYNYKLHTNNTYANPYFSNLHPVYSQDGKILHCDNLIVRRINEHINKF